MVALSQQHWRAHLSLKLTGRDDRTVISHRKHMGPLVIQKPFYPEGKPCHVYLLHPPGGVVGGDQLLLDVELNNDAHGLITTPAAGKFYRSDGRVADLKQKLKVEKGSTLEWLPQETILFSACKVKMKTQIELESDASFIGWEILCLGRPASHELFEDGSARQCFEIWRDGQPLIFDRTRLGGGDAVLNAQWGMQGHTVTGTMMAVNANKEILNHVREHVPDIEQGLFSATLIDDVLICRALSHQAEHVSCTFIHVWQRIREKLINVKPCKPRIWST